MMFLEKVNYIERFIEKLVRYINRYLKLEGIEFQKLQLGISILVINISKTIIILICSFYAGLLKETITLCILFYLFRRYSFGLHAKSSIVCTIISIIILVGGAYLGKNIAFNSILTTILYLFLAGVLIKYSPADTENNPLIGEAKRKKLKLKVIITVIILLIAKLIINNSIFSNLIVIAISSQILSIIPITYKLLGRGYNNYEKYS